MSGLGRLQPIMTGRNRHVADLCHIIDAIMLIFRNIETEYRPEELLVEYTAILGINELFSIVH